MSRRSRTGGSSHATWTTLLYLLVVFIAPLALLQTARAEDQQPLQESHDYGTGKSSMSPIVPHGPSVYSLSCFPFGSPFSTTRDLQADKFHPVIGIDLGTTYSCVGVMQKGKVEILVNDQGHRITPSYVAFTDEERLVGDAAKNQAAANPVRTIFDIK